MTLTALANQGLVLAMGDPALLYGWFKQSFLDLRDDIREAAAAKKRVAVVGAGPASSVRLSIVRQLAHRQQHLGRPLTVEERAHTVLSASKQVGSPRVVMSREASNMWTENHIG